MCFSGSGVSAGSCPAVGPSGRCRAANAGGATTGHGSGGTATLQVHQAHHQQHLLSLGGTGAKVHQEDAGGGAISACLMAERNGYKPAHLTMELLYR